MKWTPRLKVILKSKILIFHPLEWYTETYLLSLCQVFAWSITSRYILQACFAGCGAGGLGGYDHILKVFEKIQFSLEKLKPNKKVAPNCPTVQGVLGVSLKYCQNYIICSGWRLSLLTHLLAKFFFSLFRTGTQMFSLNLLTDPV